MSTAVFEEIRNLHLRVLPGQESDQSEFMGERFLPGYRDGSIDLQHLHRYSFALQFVLGKTVLDIACGEGYGCELMGQAASEVIGVDIDTSVIDLAQKRYTRPNLSFRTGSASAIPVEDASVDVVVSFETIEHVDDQNAFWCEIKRVLRKGGVLIISSPNRDVYNQQRTSQNPFHIRELSKEELVDELSERFLYHQLFSQANIFGSFLMSVSSEPIPLSVISVDPTTRVLNWHSGDDLNDPFSVAVASDEFQPSVGQSLYTGDYPPDAMASLTGGIIERDIGLRELNRQIDNLDMSRSAQVAAAQHERDEAIETAKRTEEYLSALVTETQHERDEATEAARQVEERLLKEKQLLLVQRDQAMVQRDQAMVERDQAMVERDQAMVERDQAMVKRDQAMKETQRVRETLGEQDSVVRALRTLVDEYTEHLVTDPVKRSEHNSSSENTR